LNLKPSEKYYLNVDTVATAFYSKGLLLDRFKLLLLKANFNQRPSSHGIKLVNRALKNLKIQVTHRDLNSNKYTTFQRNPRWKLLSKSMERRGRLPHFQIAYQMKLSFPNLPCVVVRGGPTRKIDLPIEDCVIPNTSATGVV